MHYCGMCNSVTKSLTCFWLQLISDLPGSLQRLLSTGCEFWCTGRMLVQVEQQTVLVEDGECLSAITSYHFIADRLFLIF